MLDRIVAAGVAARAGRQGAEGHRRPPSVSFTAMPKNGVAAFTESTPQRASSSAARRGTSPTRAAIPAGEPRPARHRRGRPVLARLDDRRLARRTAAAAARRSAAAAAGEPGHAPGAGRHLRARLGHGRRRRHARRVRLLPGPHLAHASGRRRARLAPVVRRRARGAPGRPRSRTLEGVAPGLCSVPCGTAATPRSRRKRRRSSSSSSATSRTPVDGIRTGTPATATLPAAPLEPSDIIVVTPYNAQQVAGRAGSRRRRLRRRAGRHRRQVPGPGGRRWRSSRSPPRRAADAPRGLEFLLLRNRLNVAISRAKHTAYVVYSPGPWCSTGWATGCSGSTRRQLAGRNLATGTPRLRTARRAGRRGKARVLRAANR